MARFLISTISAVGHVNPALPIARKLVERGHEVWWYTGTGFQSKVEATGARHIPIRKAIDLSSTKTVPEELMEKRNSLKGLEQFKFDLKKFFIDPGVAQLEELSEILQQFPADVILSDLCFVGASWIHEKGGPPWATLNISGLAISSNNTAPFGLGIAPDTSKIGLLRNIFLNWIFQRILLNNVTLYLDQIRGRVGLPPDYKYFFDATLSPFLYLQGTVPAFEYPRSDLPPQVHFIGPFLPDPPTNFTPPAWWDDLKSGKPVIHVTQGTVSTAADDLIIPTIQALADEDVLVVVTTGGEPIDSLKLDLVPANVRIEPFIPHYHLLPYVDVMVTNGGYNGVQVALANGVPMVAAGQTEEKPEVCARIEWAGVGINLKTKTPTPAQIKNAVNEILAVSEYRQKAQLLKADISRYDAPTQAAILLEKLAATKKPVLRIDK
ncbi:MAG: glycosyltransferase [Mojavia pulchra JT2-VF2]|jgi:UDP:flavonoid glycosyltransferase YjiC (YdhE family)|uniref:Glycosyltransferase n=1 Tax=Mojavia pulchra JT2-VF2 TaxID=287848 RepID=A0A951UHC4_9NOST|nr:glycosyltransferase [Mojavia pulchra JT2-VF2]